MNPSDTLKIGFVGAGMISQYHLTGWRQARDARVVAICDPDVDKAENRARAFDIPSVFPSMDAMLDATEIDAVDIATPVGTHVSLVTEAADRGIHVMCQKPLAPTVADAKRLIAYVGDRVRFMVHENYRFRPHYVRIRQWLTDGMVGSVVQVRMTMRCSGMVALPGQEPWLLVRQPYLGSMPRLLVFETLIHHLDTVRSLIGELNVVSFTLGRVHAALCGEDVAVIVLKTDTGILAVIDGTFSAPGYPAQVTDRIEIIGTSGTIIFEAGQLRILGRPGVDISYEEPNANTEDQECFTHAIQHFVDGLRSGAPFATDRLDNLKTLELMEGCYSAAAAYRSLGQGETNPACEDLCRV